MSGTSQRIQKSAGDHPMLLQEIESGQIYSYNTVEDLVTACRCDLQPGLAATHINNETVQITHTGIRRLFLFYPELEISRVNLDQRIEELSSQDFEFDHFEMADTPDLLIAGTFNPDLQRSFPIISLRMPIAVDDKFMVPCLSRVGEKRCLSLLGNGPYSPYTRYLLVGHPQALDKK